MSRRVQKSEVFFLYNGEIKKFKCPQGIDGVGGEWEEIDDTCLDSDGAKTVKGMADGGTISIPFKFDERIESHRIMQAMHEDPEDEGTQWAIGFSGSKAQPTIEGGALKVDDNRSWVIFDGRVKNGLAFELGQLVDGTLEIRVTSGIPKFIRKVEATTTA